MLLVYLVLANIRSVAATTVPKSCTVYERAWHKNTTWITTETYTAFRTTISTTATAPVSTSSEYSSTFYTSSTSTMTYFFYKTVASTTTTVPTPKGFVPVASLSPTPPEPLTATFFTTYCTTTLLKPTTSYVWTIYPTTTVHPKGITTVTGLYDVSTTVNKTISTSTRTVYQACLSPKNNLQSYRGKPINYAIGLDGEPSTYLSLPANKDFTRAADQSPFDCCNAIFAYPNPNITGFVYGYQFYVDVPFCYPLGVENPGGPNGWQFYTGPQFLANLTMGAASTPPKDYIYGGNCNYTVCPLSDQA